MLTVPGSITIDEDVTTAITGITVADVDAGTGNITVTLSVPGGTLAATSSGTVTVGGTATALTLTGTLADINAFIAGSNVTYTTAINNDGDVNLTVTVNDKGNTGTGGAKSDSEVITLDVQAVNDAPVAAVPASIIVTEDVASDITGISFSDVDAGAGSVTVTLSVTAGTLTAATAGGVTVTGSGTGTVMLTGTVAAINSFISGGNVDYTTAADDTTAQTLTVSIDDGGNTGSGGPKTDTETVTLNVTAVNDAPVLTVPGSISIDEDVTTAITGISVADVDAGTGNVTVTLSVPGGTLAATSSPCTVTVGGTATALTLTGTLADINAFIAGSNVTYTTAINNDGDVNLTVTVNDKGNTGTGGAKSDSEVITLDVQAVNDAPVAAVPASIIVTEDVASDITGISFSDVDAGAGSVTVTLSVTAGTLTAATAGGVTVTGSGTGTVMLTGTVAAINSFISGGNVDYTTAADDTTAQTLTVSIDDGGNTGSGGPKTDTETVTLNVTAVNDAPVLTVPGSISIDEDVTTAITGISVADVDAGTGNVTVTLSVPGGTLAATGTPSVIVGGTATALTLTGTLADINAFLGASAVTYTTALNNDGDVNLTVTVNDKGNTGTGGAKSDSEVITLDVQAVNDAPVAAVPASIIVTEDVASDITGISFSDVDAGTNNVTVTLSVSAGTLTALSGPFVAVSGSGTDSITLTGTISAINSFIASGSVDFTTPLNSNASETLTVVIDDGGNSGSGGPKTDTESVALNVTAVNDAPVAVDDSFTTDEDTPFADTVAANDSDVEGNTLTYSLVGGPIAGLTFNTDGSFAYAPPLNSNGPVTFTYQVADGKGGTDTATATIDVIPVNDAPVAGDDSFSTQEDTILNSKVSTNDSDVDGDTLTYSLVGALAGLTLNTDGTFSYAPPLNFNGVVTFDYEVDDGKGGTDTATATITVSPVNDAPTLITLDTSNVDEETPGDIIGNLTVTDQDDPLGPHSFTVDDARFEIVGGVLQLKATETLDFETEPSVTIQVTAKDAGGLTHAETFVITVNDIPGISLGDSGGADSLSGTNEGDTLSGGVDNDTLDGKDAHDSLDGGDGNDNLEGGAGNDTLDGGADSDAISGGDGNDLIIWDPSDSAINAGKGIDTIFLNGSDIDLSAAISGIEIIDMKNGGPNSVTLSATDVIAVSETSTITIAGDSDDTIFSGGGWALTGPDGKGNDIYTQITGFGTATLVVDQDINFVNV